MLTATHYPRVDSPPGSFITYRAAPAWELWGNEPDSGLGGTLGVVIVAVSAIAFLGYLAFGGKRGRIDAQPPFVIS